MATTPLTKEEILSLSNLLKENFKLAQFQRETHPLAKYIQFPKVPPILSESIIRILIIQKKLFSELTIDEISLDHSQADILIQTPEGAKKVEVKATGKSAFQNFGEKDIAADYIIWLHFNTFFSNKIMDTFEVLTITNPKKYFSKPLKITLGSVKKIVPDLTIHTFKLTEL